MPPRERWIVYPLLFMTLGIAIRNQFLPTNIVKTMDLEANQLRANELTVGTIRCNNLLVKDMDFETATGKKMTVKGLLESLLHRSIDANFLNLKVTDEQGQPVIVMLEDKNSHSGVIQTMSASGTPQVQIRSNDTGGIVTAIGQSGHVLVAMGHEGQSFGVFGQFPQSPPFLLTPSWKPQTQPATPNTPPEQKKDDTKKEETKP